LIDVFRSSDYYKDVVWQSFGALHAPIEVNELLEESLDEFRAKFSKFLLKFTMIRSRTYDPILSKISKVKEVRNALTEIFHKRLNPQESFEAIKNIPGSGIFFSSTILSLAFAGRYIVFSDGVWNGFESLFPLLEEQIEKPNNYRLYLQFQHMCEAIADVYGFESMAELHEFLWHGHDTNWAF